MFDCIKWQANEEELKDTRRTDSEGYATFPNLDPGMYVICYGHYPEIDPTCVPVQSGCIKDVCLQPVIGASIDLTYLTKDCKLLTCPQPQVGDLVQLTIPIQNTNKNLLWDKVSVKVPRGFRQEEGQPNPFTYIKRITQSGRQELLVSIGLPKLSSRSADSESDFAVVFAKQDVHWDDETPLPVSGNINVSMTRAETSFTPDIAFWTGIRNSTEALSFNNYLRFMDVIFYGGDRNKVSPLFEQNRFTEKEKRYNGEKGLLSRRFLPFTDTDAYRVVKAATEAFVMVNCGNLLPGSDSVQQKSKVSSGCGDLQPFDNSLNGDNAYLDRRDLPAPPNGDLLCNSFNRDYLGKEKILPYLAVIRQKLPDIPIKLEDFGVTDDLKSGQIADNCFGILQEKLANPCMLELIWSYWHEEGMLVQSMNAISRRFQNMRAPNAHDPLANLEMNPLRPLNNLMWGYIQDEQHRLTVGRRNGEYTHLYGLQLEGKAVQNLRPADTRSKFLEGFHHLLRLCTVFYKQDDNTTVKADAFPVLNALKEVHLILSEGAHNQFGDLPSTARIEMLMQQWFLARPEFREFLPTRIMVAYPEPWMDRVDALKKLQGWTDTSVLHFRNLGMFGEQLLLSIRWDNWSDEYEPVKALNWARYHRPHAQGYIHAYRAATGVDLSADPTVNTRVDSTLPSLLLQKRLATQQRAS